jgi:hypothetical protein
VYYHFAYMVISIAMLGLSISGVAIYLFPNFFRVRRMPILASLFTLGFALLTLWTLKTTLANPMCSGLAISLAIAGCR